MIATPSTPSTQAAASQGACYACGRKLGRHPKLVDTRDAQQVYVGSECFKQIEKAGDAGWQPPKGGVRLYLLKLPQSKGDPADTAGYVMHRPGPQQIGGVLILLDRENGADWIEGDERWVIYHDPSSYNVTVPLRREAEALLRATSRGDDTTGLIHDIILGRIATGDTE